MRELETLEIRLAGALNRISAHLDKPDRQDDNFELERIERLERRILILTDQNLNKIFYFNTAYNTNNFISNFLACISVLSVLNLDLNNMKRKFTNFS